MDQPNTPEQRPLIRPVNRRQMSWRAVDVERLIDEDHLARAIWHLVGRLDLTLFYRAIESSAQEGGRPAFDPQLLISLWVYAYSQGIGSAREVARRCEYDPAFQWLTGLDEVNYHSLADFRVDRQRELDELFTQVLAALSKERLITLEQVMQDGTKIKALASTRSYREEGTIREHLERARQRVAEMGDPRSEELNPRTKQARARARREQQERLEGALQELERLQAPKPGKQTKKSKARVSTSDPQARGMHQSDGGLALSYNAQLSTDAAHGLIVAAAVTQEASDSGQLLPAVDRLAQRLKKTPRQMMADAGYTTRAAIEAMAERGIDFLGRMIEEQRRGKPRDRGRFPPAAFVYDRERDCFVCPEGKVLGYEGRHTKKKGFTYYRYEAEWQDCQRCSRKPQCCPENQKQGRTVVRGEESAAIHAFQQKMASEEAQAQYRCRGPVAEFCHAWIKSKFGLRQFHVRGLLKVQMELLWTCLTYNLRQWIRLRNTAPQPATAS